MTTASVPELIDARVLVASCGGDDVVLGAIQKALAGKLPPQVVAVTRALDDGDLPRLREAAHRLCGAVAPFSTIARDLVTQIEDGAEQGESPARLRVLVERLDRVAPELIRQVSGLSMAVLLASLN